MPISLDLNTIIFIVMGLAIIALFALVIHQHSKLKKFLIGHKSENLNDSISNMNLSIKELETFRTGLEEYLTTVEERLKKSTQAIYTVRFNPFKGTGSGGNQSFATAYLNEHGDGVVVSSLYAREHVSIFSKPVKQGRSEFELSEEEKEAIKGALEMVG